eukprot:scaffold33608_cov169-Skeletonema_dohrnii-CCMP3373.AAC.2
MEKRSCWHFDRCTLPPTSTKAKHPSSQTEKLCLETELESYKALLVMERWSCWQFNRRTLPSYIDKGGLVGTSIPAHYHPTSTKAKNPSSQTEKMCLETEFLSYKALILVRPISRLAPHDLACRWKDGLVGTSIPAHYHPTSTKAKYPSSQTEKMCLETEFESYKALLVVIVSYKSVWGV